MHDGSSSKSSTYRSLLLPARMSFIYACRPIEAAVVLLPLFEFMHLNPLFPSMLAETLNTGRTEDQARYVPPLPVAITSLASYIVSHASSMGSPRAMAYANVALANQLVWVECDGLLETLLQPTNVEIRLCRQVKCSLQAMPFSTLILHFR